MEKRLDKFESFIKESVENHEVAYNASAWTALEAKLGAVKKPFYKSTAFIASLAAVVVAGGLFIGYNLTQDAPVNNELVSQDIKTPLEINTATESINKVSIEKLITEEFERVDKGEISQVNVETTDNTKVEAIQETENNSEVIDNAPKAVRETPMEVIKETSENKTPLTLVEDKIIKEPVVKDKKVSSDFAIANKYCAGETLSSATKVQKSDYAYTWLLNNKVVSTKAKLVIAKLPADAETLTLEIKNKDGKVISSTKKDLIVNEAPEAIITTLNDKYSVINKTTFELSDDFKSVVWNFGDGQSSKDQLAEHTYNKQGIYNVSATVENEKGCKSIIKTQPQKVEGYYNIRKDFGFSPDGDGSLDYFLPGELNQINQPFEMIVYRRSGAPIFQTNSINQPWDGRTVDGSMATFGAYVWIIKLTNELGNEEIYKGTVTKATK